MQLRPGSCGLGTKISKISSPKGAENDPSWVVFLRPVLFGDKRLTNLPAYQKDHSWATCLYLSVVHERSAEAVLIDCGPEISGMSKVLAKEWPLMVHTDHNYIRTAIGDEESESQHFVGELQDFCTDINCIRDYMTLQAPRTTDLKFLMSLGTPYQMASRMVTTKEEDGDCIFTLQNQDDGRTSRLLAAEDHIDNKQTSKKYAGLERRGGQKLKEPLFASILLA